LNNHLIHFIFSLFSLAHSLFNFFPSVLHYFYHTVYTHARHYLIKRIHVGGIGELNSELRESRPYYAATITDIAITVAPYPEVADPVNYRITWTTAAPIITYISRSHRY